MYYLKLEGKPWWFRDWEYQTWDSLRFPVWDKREDAHKFYTEELAQNNKRLLEELGCRVLIVRAE